MGGIEQTKEERLKEWAEKWWPDSCTSNSRWRWKGKMGRKEGRKKTNAHGGLRGTSFQIVRGWFDPAVMLIFSSSCHGPACCFSTICFNKSGITTSPPLSSVPGWCGVECLLLSATPSTRSSTQQSLSEKGQHLLDPWDRYLKIIITVAG